MEVEEHRNVTAVIFHCEGSLQKSVPFLGPCASPHPVVPRAFADGWAHLLQISFESRRDSAVASLLLQWTQRKELSV